MKNGSITPIIPDLIEIGVNVLNPVQPNVMDLRELAERFGEKLTFFGGICNQKVLPFGTPEEIDALEEAGALQDVAHMPARVKCAELAWRTLDGMLEGQANQ